MVKNFGGKKVWQKGCCKGLVKKTLVNVDLHYQSTINSNMKQLQTIVLLAWPDHFFGAGCYHLQYKLRTKR